MKPNTYTMAYFLKSLSAGQTTWHLSTDGRDVFHSRLYSTCGALLAQVICRDGKILDRQTLVPVDDAELLDLLRPAPAAIRPSWRAVAGSLRESFRTRHRHREMHFNPLLG